MKVLFSQQRRMFTLMVSILLLSLALAACGSSANSGGSTGGTTSTGGNGGKGCKKVGVLLPDTASSARWDGVDKPDLEAGIPKALPGATVDYTNANGNAATQQNQAEQDLTKGDCILVVAAQDGVAASAIVQSAKKQGVPVIAYDRLIQDNDLKYYVSFDNTQVGALQGQYVVDHYKDFTSKTKNLVMINGSKTDNNALLFNAGAVSKIQPLVDSGALKKVYDVFTPDWNNDTARTEMDQALTANQNNVAVAYVANDGMANSVIASLKAQHLNGKVLVTGQDATVAGIQNILTGDQGMTVYKAITKEATATAQLVAAISNGTDTASLTNGQTTKTQGGAAIPSVLETPVAVDKTNIVTTVIADGFVTKADVCKGLPAGTGGIC
jgi:D-xylose transport system substrate-binding protein